MLVASRSAPLRGACVTLLRSSRQAAVAPPAESRCLLTTSILAATLPLALVEIREAELAGADAVELRLDFLDEPLEALPALLSGCHLPAVVTFRAAFEQPGRYNGPEEFRLRTLWQAVELGAAFVDVELKAAAAFFELAPASWLEAAKAERETQPSGEETGHAPRRSRIILSSHDYTLTPDLDALLSLHDAAVRAGADIVKIATFATSILDVGRLEALLSARREFPTIALGMGECGLLSRLLAPKFGSFLTFGALRAGKESAPGQPTLAQLVGTYRLPQQRRTTRVLGVIGKPISHSRSPMLHNAALALQGQDVVYVPLLVDDLVAFLTSSPFNSADFHGFSVTIPHKRAALLCCDEVDPLARSIGAVNTLVRREDGSLKGYNTDCTAALNAIEAGLGCALAGKSILVVGAGGAGRAIAFGAAFRGARVMIANRTDERAAELARDVTAHHVLWDDLQAGSVQADVLANTSPVGMQPDVDGTPVPASALVNFSVVFDAVYTPLETRLLREAAAARCTPVNGVEMFVGQAAEQFELFTGMAPPVDTMRAVVLKSLGA